MAPPPTLWWRKGADRWAWFGLFGPGKMAPTLVKRLRDEAAAVLAEPETLAKILRA